MYKDNNQLQKADDNAVILRYLDFISFFSLLRNKSLFFKRLDKYSDRLEGQLFLETVEEHIQWLLLKDPFMDPAEAQKRAELNAEHIKNYRRWTLSNSWNMDDNENYAMWKIYLRGSNEGVAIQTTVGKLKEQLNKNPYYQLTAGKVTYKPLKHFDINQFSVSASKRPPYEYEKEYRALIINQYDSNTYEPLHLVGADVAINVVDLIDRIYISPFATSWFETMVKQLISDFLPGFKDEDILWSSIQDV